MKTAAIAIHSFAKRLLFNVIFRRLLSRTLLVRPLRLVIGLSALNFLSGTQSFLPIRTYATTSVVPGIIKINTNSIISYICRWRLFCQSSRQYVRNSPSMISIVDVDLTNNRGIANKNDINQIIVTTNRTYLVVLLFLYLTGYRIARHLSRLIIVIVKILAVIETPETNV
jgi:hypothetical protein